ncbi:serine/arginine repetitive matrix protein 1-like [Impatiens glandulifera]|uniref:serine/arginine repetitive matrix protein 1-like n=1 Tax=Impatiens glandulifera TaxID=253017 RepID=UPI001FB05D8B|nr:serine/arginine repetitive matrix protein 1-like [Impatiens glandulifera]
MVVKKDGRVQAFAMQIVKIIKFLNVELGEGEPLPSANVLNSEQMSKKTAKAARPKSSRTKSSKGTSSSAPLVKVRNKKIPRGRRFKPRPLRRKREGGRHPQRRAPTNRQTPRKLSPRIIHQKEPQTSFSPLPSTQSIPFQSTLHHQGKPNPRGAKKPSQHRRR